MIAKWKEYLDKNNQIENNEEKNYNYPVMDTKIDAGLSIQDKEKVNREDSLILEFLNREWNIGIDFGCGPGSKFHLFDTKNNINKLLIGIDPDCSRLMEAKKVSENKLKYINTRVVCNGINLLENAPNELKTDIITCIQVLGHVSRNQTEKIIRFFHKILKDNGSCALAIPIIGEKFLENHDAGDWSGKEDFFHIVKIGSLPYKKGYRRMLNPEEYDEIAANPIFGKLQVRSFFLKNFPDPKTMKLPFNIEQIPQSLEKIIHKYFEIEKMAIYSIHRDKKDYNYPVGDALLFLNKI